MSEEPKIEDVVPDAAAQAIPESNEMEDLTEDIFENFGLCLQIVEDFISGKISDDTASLTPEQKSTREKVLSCLMIDCFMRKADYAKFYTDIDMATDDYQSAIRICQKFTVGNERIMSSAL